MSERGLLTPAELRAGLDALDAGWSGDADSLTRTVEFDSFPTAVRFVDELAPQAEQMDHHPDLAISWRTVTITLRTHSSGGVTPLDLALAVVLDGIIRGLPTNAGHG
jgi:4a-hydroxytetrahydrobiopterin dehydratase